MTLTNSIDYSKIGASKLFIDYLKNDDSLMSFFGDAHFAEISSWESRIKKRESFVDRSDLVDALIDFNKPFNPPASTIRQIERLREESTFTIVTGQQLTLFGGPLYTFLKTITTIKVTALLSKRFNVHVIPVFWLADEDHDLEEISEVNVPNKEANLSIKVQDHPQVGFAAGSLALESSITNVLSNFLSNLPETEFKAEIASMMISSWSPDNSWRSAFGKTMLHFFAEQGLILAGSHHSLIKKLSKPLFCDAVSKNKKVVDALKKTSEHLQRKWHIQAQVSDSTLFFHDAQKGRIKLIKEDGAWKSGDTSWTESELLLHIQQQTDCFSPNVFLRPLLQEYLLPNLAYIGGQAEIAYHAQMLNQFELFGLQMPILIPRLSVTLSEPAMDRYFDDLPFRFEDYKKRTEDLEKAFIQGDLGVNVTEEFEQWKQQMSQLILSKEALIHAYDATLASNVKALSAKTLGEIDKLNQKINRSLKQRQSIQLNRILRLKQAYFPNNIPQERYVSWLWFLSKYGSILINILSNIITEDFESLKKHHVVRLNDNISSNKL